MIVLGGLKWQINNDTSMKYVSIVCIYPQLKFADDIAEKCLFLFGDPKQIFSLYFCKKTFIEK